MALHGNFPGCYFLPNRKTDENDNFFSFSLFDPTPQKVSARAVIFGAKRRDFGSLNIAAVFYGFGGCNYLLGSGFFLRETEVKCAFPTLH